MKTTQVSKRKLSRKDASFASDGVGGSTFFLQGLCQHVSYILIYLKSGANRPVSPRAESPGSRTFVLRSAFHCFTPTCRGLDTGSRFEVFGWMDDPVNLSGMTRCSEVRSTSYEMSFRSSKIMLNRILFHLVIESFRSKSGANRNPVEAALLFFEEHFIVSPALSIGIPALVPQPV
jgi:hypothetical protein